MNNRNKLIFLVPVWGEKYISIMLEGLLPSLLTPRNFPVLSKDKRSILSIITNTEGQSLIKSSQVIERCQEFLRVNIVAGDDLIGGNKYSSMTKLYVLGLSGIELEDSNNVVYLTPDMFFSDGAVLSLLKYLDQGMKQVFILSLRVDKNKFLSKSQHLTNGIDDDFNFFTQLTLSSLHPMSHSLNVLGRTFNNNWPSHLYWIKKDILVAHGFHWHPLMASYPKFSIKSLVEKFSVGDCPTIDDKAFLSTVNFENQEILAVTNPREMMCVEMSDVLDDVKPQNYQSLPSIFSILLWSHSKVNDFQWFLFSHKVIFSLPDSVSSEELICESNRLVHKILKLKKNPILFIVFKINQIIKLISILVFQPRRVAEKIFKS